MLSWCSEVSSALNKAKHTFQNGDTYQYEPFNSPRSEIRLLSVQPGKLYSTVRCSLSIVRLEDEPSYEALSYTWGGGKDKRPVYVDGTLVKVSANLETALRYLRHPESPRVLWIDALCINQQDYGERNTQVLRMYDIYKQADNVIAWLGKAGEGSRDGLEFVTTFALFLKANGVTDREASLQFDQNASGRGKSAHEEYKELGFSFDNRAWLPLFNLMDRPYWTRMWILQELAARGYWGFGDTRPCRVQCGPDSASLHDLQLVCDHIVMIFSWPTSPSLDEKGSFHEPIKSIKRVGSGKEFHQPSAISMLIALGSLHLDRHTSGSTLPRLLDLTLGLEAEDEHDKLYALLGLIPSDQSVIPDYQKSLEDMLVGYVKTSVQRNGKLNVIHSNRLDPCASGLPSWTPEIRKRFALQSRWETEMRDMLFSASGDRKADVKFSVCQGKPVMHAKGLIVGETDHVMGPPIKVRYIDEKIDGQLYINLMIEGLKKFAADLEYPSPEYDAFWRTVVRHQAPADSKSLHIGGLVFLEKATVEEFLGENTPEEVRAFVDKFFDRAWKCLVNRSFFTAKGQPSVCMGLGPFDTRAGDLVVVLFGSEQCLVLRPWNEMEGYRIIGTSYVHGVMQGELLEAERNEMIFDLY